MECGISFYVCVLITVCMCSQVSGDITMEGTMLRFESRLSHLELVVFSMKASLSKLNGRLDKIETAIPQQHQQTTDDNTSVFSDIKENDEHEQVNRANKAVIGAFISEKQFIRNTISKYEEQFIELKYTVHDQIAIINATIGAQHKRFEQTIKDNELRFNDTLVLHGTNMGIKLQGVRRDFEDTLSIAVNDTFIPEIRIIRNTITEYGKQFIELQNTVHDQIVIMNETIGAQHKCFENTIKDNELRLNDTLELHGTSMDIKLQGVRRDLEDTLSIAVNDTFIPEKLFIRNTITEYGEQFIELQNTVHDQIVIMNATLDASERRFGHIHKETEQRVYSSLEQHEAGMDIKLEGVRRNVTVVKDTFSSAISNVQLTLSNQLDDVNQKIRNIERKIIPVGILPGPETVMVKENDDVSLHCGVYGNPKPTVTWRKGSQPLTSEYRYETFRNGTLLIRWATERDVDNYTCTADNGVTSPVERTIKLELKDDSICILKKDPGSCSDWSVRWFYDYENRRCDRFWYGGCYGNGNNFMTEAECQRACSVPGPEYEGDNRERGETLVPATPGESVTLDCSYGGEVTWYRNGKLVEADRRRTFNPDGKLVVRETNIEDDGIYECHVRENNGRPTVYSFMLQVKVPVDILPGPEKVIVNLNADVFLHCEVSGYPKPTVTWRKGPRNLTLSDHYETLGNGTLLIRSATERDIDSYTCTADNGVTSPVEQTIKLELKAVSDGKCADSASLIKCRLIVTARLCGYSSFSKICCSSCELHLNGE